MFKKLLIFTSLLSSIIFSSSALSSNTKLMLKKDYPNNYIVKKGDTLWDISTLFLNSPWLWPKLWEINPDINNPHLIYPGDKLSLTWHNGNPVLRIKPLKKLSPQIHTVVKEPIPTLPTSVIVPYLQSDRLIDAVNYHDSYRVLGTSDGRKFLSTNERVYVDTKLVHKEWGIYRLVKAFSRKGKESTAYALRLVGVAELAESNEDISGLKIIKQQQEISINDVVLPISSDDIKNKLTTTFYPQPGPLNINASILGSIDGGDYLAVNQVAVIDRGSDDGLQQGSMFILREEGNMVHGNKGEYYYDLDKDKKEGIQLPQIEVGEFIVIRPYEKFSLVLITRSERPIDKNTIVISPKKEDG